LREDVHYPDTDLETRSSHELSITPETRRGRVRQNEEELEEEEEEQDNIQSSEGENGDFSLQDEDESFLPEDVHYPDNDLEIRSSHEPSITPETRRGRVRQNEEELKEEKKKQNNI
jgi:hypothetical protein